MNVLKFFRFLVQAVAAASEFLKVENLYFIIIGISIVSSIKGQKLESWILISFAVFLAGCQIIANGIKEKTPPIYVEKYIHNKEKKG